MSEDTKDKPTYQAPKVMPLGELAKGEGAPCRDGGSATMCNAGGTASNNCTNGFFPFGRCGQGTFPR